MHLEIFGGTEYGSFNKQIQVNSDSPTLFETDICTAQVVVRIHNFQPNNLEAGQNDSTYFEDPARKGQRFSIQFQIEFKQDVSGNDLVWGNDFDGPIRDLLPWGFSVAFNTFKRLIDPSVEGDVYADKPYLYGPCLTSVNYICEGAPKSTPIEDNLEKTRKKDYLDANKRKEFVFKKGSTYAFDFCTPYLEMSSKLAIELPGFTFDVGHYANKTTLRYVLKDEDALMFGIEFRAVE